MKKLTITLSFLAILLPSLSSDAEMVTRTRLVVDTVKALQTIHSKIDKANAPHLEKIRTLKTKSEILEQRLKENGDSIKLLEELNGYVAPKVKEKDKAEKIFNFVSGSIDKLPDDFIFSYCKEKDIEKAKKKDQPGIELQKLKNKTKENLLKNTKKGDLSSDFASECILYFYSKNRNEKNRLLNQMNNTSTDLMLEHNNIIVKPATFTASTWLKNMPETAVPTKTITIRREKRGPDDLSYNELMDKYYRYFNVTSELGGDIFDVSGKFDGLIADKIGVFPVENSRYKPEYMDNDDWKCYKKIAIVSEKGSIPELIITSPKAMGENGFYIFTQYDGERNANFEIEDLKSRWIINGEIQQRDGLLLNLHPGESTIGVTYTYVLENGKWVNKSPLNVEYMSYEDCMNLIKETGGEVKTQTFNYRTLDEGYDSDDSYMGERETVNIIAFIDETLGLNKPGESKVCVKSKSVTKNFDNEYYSLPDLIIDSKNVRNIYVEKDFWSRGDDAVVVVYDNIGINGNEPKLDFYRIVFQGPDYGYLNGIGRDDSVMWAKRAEGIYSTETDEISIYKVKEEYEDY